MMGSKRKDHRICFLNNSSTHFSTIPTFHHSKNAARGNDFNATSYPFSMAEIAKLWIKTFGYGGY